jgi:hypothetical protein
VRTADTVNFPNVTGDSYYIVIQLPSQADHHVGLR